jgi:hypothetical protein
MYNNYVRSGKEFLEEWVREGLMDVDGVIQVDEERSSFSKAFDSVTDRTPTALCILLAYKCEHEGKGFATAESIRSAFKMYFERYVLYLPFLSSFFGF